MVPGFFSNKISGKVQPNGVEPGEEFLARMKVLQFLVSSDEGFLGKVGRLVGRARHPAHEIENGLLVALYQGAEGVHLSPQDPINTVLFVVTVHEEN
jgi:hypothetical protein